MLSPRLRRVGFGVIGAIGLAVAVFKGSRCWNGEALARSLKSPIRSLCHAYHPEESGGCYADCQKRVAVSDAQSSLRAARAFAAIPRHESPEIESRLARVRTASAAVKAALTATCTFSMEAYAPITPEIERCAALVRATHTIGDLISAVDDLADYASSWSGAEILSMKTCRTD
jgi:hypothetical protein